MKTLILILSIGLLASCSTTYKSGQTPDDVYYSKPRVEAESTTKVERRTGRYEDTYEDTQIRMAIRNQRWRSLDFNNDFNCNYNPYSYGYNYGYYYNPYFYPYPVYNVYNGGVNFVNPKNTTVRSTNLGSYSNSATVFTPTKAGSINRSSVTRRYYDSNNPTRRNIDLGGSSDNRTYSPSSGGNSGGSSNRPSGTTVTRPSRGR